MKVIQKFVCDHCNREYRSVRGIERHEPACYHNPITKSCATCELLVAQAQDYHMRRMGEDICQTSLSVLCEDGWDTGKDYNPHEPTQQTNCPFWKARESKGTHWYGGRWIRKID